MNAQLIIVLVLVAVALLVALAFAWRMKPTEKPEPKPTREPPKKHRVMVVGLGFTHVAANGEATITATPQRFFQLKTISIPSSVAQHFVLVDCQVAGCTISQGFPLSCEAFTETAANVRIEWPPVEVGETISLRVLNLSDEPRVFSAMLLGTGERPEREPSPLSSEAEGLLRELAATDPEDWMVSEDDLAVAEEVIRAMPSTPATSAALDQLRRARQSHHGRA